MPSQSKRRTLLSMVGSSIVVSLAGCIGSPDSNDSNDSVDQTVGSPDSDESNDSSDQSQESITPNNLPFTASVEEHFTETHPGRIQVTLTNTLETPVILSTGITPPFTSYLSGDQSDENRLVLVPDVSEDESPLDWMGGTDPIPTNAENGCWNVTQEVQIEELGAEIELAQGETSSQQYDVYGYQNDQCPLSGSYQFEDTLRLFNGPPSDDTSEHELALAFTITLDEGRSLSVEGDDLTVTTTED